MRVAIVGASGFAGVAVTEYMIAKGVEIVPLVGSTGSSWRLISQGLTPRVTNVLDPKDIGAALAGCTHVVNCSRGGDRVMLQGMDNLLRAASQAGVSRFVHLSSVAVYGDPPPPEATVESAPTSVEKGSYGWIKLCQDEKIRRSAARGLSSIILCPPNILGPASYFLLHLQQSLLQDKFLLADGGACICNTVDVRNLAHACFLALTQGSSAGDRYFVTDGERVSWGNIVDRVRAAARIAQRPPECTLAELEAITARPAAAKPTVWRSVKHLVSSDVRQALRKDPLLAKCDGAVRGFVAALGAPVEDSLRLAIEGPLAVSAKPAEAKIDLRLSAQQLRGVLHSCEKAKVELGYRRVYTFAQSMDAFARWLECARGMGEPDWASRKLLFGYQ